MRTTVATLFIPIVLAACLMVGCGQNSSGELSEEGKKDRLTVVSLVKPQMQNLPQTTTQPATVHPYWKTEIHAKVSGYLKDLNVDIGQPVDINTPLAIISVPEMLRAKESQDAEIKRLEAIEDRRVAEKNLALAQVKATAALKGQAQAQVKQADSQMIADLAERDRVKALVADMSVALRLLTEAENRYQSSKAAKSAAEFGLKSIDAQVEVAGEKVTVAQKVWEAANHETTVAKKKLAELKELMNYATLTAPFKGIVTERNVEKGDLVRNIQTASEKPRQPLFVVSDLSQVRIRVMVPEVAAPLVKEGADVTFTLRSLQGKTFHVKRLSYTLDERTRTMLVEVVVPNPKGELLPGMYGEATITLKQKQQALMLPAGAVRFDKKGIASVYVVNADDTVREVPVKTGIDRGDEIEITAGLKADDRIVGPMIGRLQPGQKIRVKTK
jgi:HlyD family secretion protein